VSPTKEELIQQAADQGVDVNDTMTKDEIEEAMSRSDEVQGGTYAEGVTLPDEVSHVESVPAEVAGAAPITVQHLKSDEDNEDDN